MDNPFDIPASGQADWDSGLQADFLVIERGYHVTERAGQAISSGQVLTLNSGGFFFPYAPGSASIAPHAYTYTAAASGDSLTAVAWGIVRSLDINSPAVPGKLAFATASGFLSVATLGLPVGTFLTGRGVLFNPSKAAGGGGGGGGGALGDLTDVDTTGLADGKVLTWVEADSKWEPVTPTGGGGGAGLLFQPPVVSSFSMVGSPLSINSTPTGTSMYIGSCSSGDKLNGYVMDLGIAPATPFTITAAIDFMIPGTNFASAGLFITDGTKFQTWWAQHNSGLLYAANRFSNRTSFDTNLSGNQTLDVVPKFFRITDTGSQYEFSMSPDGFNFMKLFTGTNSYLNVASNIYVGFGGDCNASSGDIIINASYFEKT